MSLYSTDHDIWRAPQQKLLIQAAPKFLAPLVPVCRETLLRWQRGDYPVPAYQAFAISKAQNNFDYVRWLAEKAGAVLHLPRPVVGRRPTILLLADLALNFGGFFELAEKIQREEPLTDEEQRELEEQGAGIKAAVDALVERSREQRRKKEPTP